MNYFFSILLELLQSLMEEGRDSKTNLVVLDPNPETYYYKRFGRFAALEIAADSSWDYYRGELESGPQPSPADSLAVNSFVVIEWNVHFEDGRVAKFRGEANSNNRMMSHGIHLTGVSKYAASTAD